MMEILIFGLMFTGLFTLFLCEEPLHMRHILETPCV